SEPAFAAAAARALSGAPAQPPAPTRENLAGAGGVGTPRDRARTAAVDQRGPALGRRFDRRVALDAGRAGAFGTAAAAVHGPSGVCAALVGPAARDHPHAQPPRRR